MTRRVKRRSAPSQGRPHFRIAAAIVAVVLVAFLTAGVWLASGGPSSSGSSSSGFSSGGADTSQGLSWRYRQFSVAADLLPVQPGSVVAFDDGYVGVCDGVDPSGGAGYCSSQDGLSWSADSPARLPQGTALSSIAKGEAGFVLVGSSDATGSTPAAFFSADGHAWQAASVTGSATSGMVDAVAGPSGYVAAGWDQTNDSTFTPLTLWHSPDGLTWRSSPSPISGQGALFSTGTSYLLSGPGETPTAGRLPLWRSEDGRSWQRVAFTGQIALRAVDDVIRLGDGTLLATGHGDPVSGANPVSVQHLLRSTDDGRTWQEFHIAADDGFVPLGRGAPATLVQSGGVLLGLEFSESADVTTVSVSRDGGATWDPLTDPVFVGSGDELGSYDAPVQLGDGVFVAETFQSVDVTDTVFWVGRPLSSEERGGAASWILRSVAVAGGLIVLASLGYGLRRWWPNRKTAKRVR